MKTAIEVTGLGAGLNQTLDCMAKFGRVALLGCTRDSDFTVDYYRKVHGPGIQLIGAHTMARPSCESAPGYFTAEDDMKTLIKLCALGRNNLCLLGTYLSSILPIHLISIVFFRIVTGSNTNTQITIQFSYGIREKWRGHQRFTDTNHTSLQRKYSCSFFCKFF